MTVSSKKGERSPVQAAPGPISLDPETAAELSRFNQYVALREEADRRERALKKAEADKERAAAAVRELEGDAKATKESKAEAEQAYKDALAHLTAVKEGKVPDQAPTPDTDGVTADESDATQADATQADAYSPDPEGEGEGASGEPTATASDSVPTAEDASGSELDQVSGTDTAGGATTAPVPVGDASDSSPEAKR